MYEQLSPKHPQQSGLSQAEARSQELNKDGRNPNACAIACCLPAYAVAGSSNWESEPEKGGRHPTSSLTTKLNAHPCL